MLWIALHLPALPLESFAATLGAAEPPPLALLDGRGRLAAVNAAAAAAGAQPGMRRATALALAPRLVLGRADAAREAQALQALAHAALGFTPAVTLQGPHMLLLEVSTTLRLFGGLAALRRRLHQALDALAPLGRTRAEGHSPTALGAALLARAGLPAAPGPGWRATLDAQPVAHLVELAELPGHPADHAQALQGMGVHTLAQLRALPRAGLARRFGPALLQALDRARGEVPDPRTWLSLPDAFDARLELHARADTGEQVLHGAQVLLQRLVAWARAHRARVRRCVLVMPHERTQRAEAAELPATTLTLSLASPIDDATHLAALLRERLAHTALAAPTLELQLRCDDLARIEAPSGELFATPGSTHEGYTRLLERLQARLGAQGVQTLQVVADHRPERATTVAPAAAEAGREASAPARREGHKAAPRPACQEAKGEEPARAASPVVPRLTRPAWLLPEPQALPERQHQPLLEGRALQLLAGPERIEAGWWEGGEDAPALRDYFIAQAHDGALVWVYRLRLPREDEPGGWFLHGRFA
ncbi:MAG: DNA polymerase Y family protein [Rubrivivax sp.]